MNELAAYQHGGLPGLPGDLAKFIVVAQEKIKAVKAEIRAIQRLDMAKEVYDQKIEEQARLQELTLLAYQRMGEITRELPKGSGNQYVSASSRKREEADSQSEDFKVPSDRKFEKTQNAGNQRSKATLFEREVASEGGPRKEIGSARGTDFVKPKSEVVRDLGFSTSQVGRMEQMAAHPDVVEEVIAESQAGQTEATQTEVLRRIKERESNIIDLSQAKKNQHDRDMDKIGRDYANLKLFRKATSYQMLYEITDEVLESVVDTETDLQDAVCGLNEAIRLLTDIRSKLLAKGAKHGKAGHYKGNQGAGL